MKGCSTALTTGFGKPESYVAIAVFDKADIIWGGSDAPFASGTVNSLGAINKENNGAVTKAVSGLLADYNVPADRIYITFFDVPRENMGYNSKTFAD